MLANFVNHTPNGADAIRTLAADMIRLNAEGDACRRRLIELGHSPDFIDQNENEARRQANATFVRDINADLNEARPVRPHRCGGYNSPITDHMAMLAIEGGMPMADCFAGFFEAYPPHSRTMEEWAEACASELAYGPDIICFDDEEGYDL